MSVKGSEADKANDTIPANDREWFWRENAVALIKERDRLIRRLRRRIVFLERQSKGRANEIARLQAKFEVCDGTTIPSRSSVEEQSDQAANRAQATASDQSVPCWQEDLPAVKRNQKDN